MPAGRQVPALVLGGRTGGGASPASVLLRLPFSISFTNAAFSIIGQLKHGIEKGRYQPWVRFAGRKRAFPTSKKPL